MTFSSLPYSNAADQGIGLGQSDFIHHDFFIVKVCHMQEKKRKPEKQASK
jgi:hypothetical protein